MMRLMARMTFTETVEHLRGRIGEPLAVFANGRDAYGLRRGGTLAGCAGRLSSAQEREAGVWVFWLEGGSGHFELHQADFAAAQLGNLGGLTVETRHGVISVERDED
jgi:hypothetical protein